MIKRLRSFDDEVPVHVTVIMRDQLDKVEQFDFDIPGPDESFLDVLSKALADLRKENE